MNQSYQNKASDQICKIQNDKKLISFHDRLRAAPNTSYAQLHGRFHPGLFQRHRGAQHHHPVPPGPGADPVFPDPHYRRLPGI